MEYNHRFYLFGLTKGFWWDALESCKGWAALYPVNSKPETVAKIIILQGKGLDGQLRNKTEVLAKVFAQDGHFVLRGQLSAGLFPWESFRMLTH